MHVRPPTLCTVCACCCMAATGWGSCATGSHWRNACCSSAGAAGCSVRVVALPACPHTRIRRWVISSNLGRRLQARQPSRGPGPCYSFLASMFGAKAAAPSLEDNLGPQPVRAGKAHALPCCCLPQQPAFALFSRKRWCWLRQCARMGAQPRLFSGLDMR